MAIEYFRGNCPTCGETLYLVGKKIEGYRVFMGARCICGYKITFSVPIIKEEE